MDYLDHIVNRFDGIVVNPEALPQDPGLFARLLARSLALWQEKEYQIVWLEIPADHARLVPEAVEGGFGYHHCEQSYVMLVYRLVDDAFVPPFATHYIGAGGVVINEENKLLVVSERHRSSARPYYKLPGGALHQGEHLVDGVLREVLEETGVEARFESLACFRHWHGYRYGKSDIYFICRLAPLNEEIVMEDGEIDECFWMPVDDYMASELVSLFNKEIVRAAIESTGIVSTWIDGYDDPTRREFFSPPGIGTGD